MSTALTTIDLLVAAIQHSYLAANALILCSSQNATDSASPPIDPSVALHQEAQFIIANALGNPSATIPLTLFQSPVRYYLSSLHFDLPCYTMSGMSFFKGLRKSVPTTLYAFAPTLWQRLFYRCHLYHLIIEIDVDQIQVSFRALPAEELALQAEKRKGSPAQTTWAIRLTPAQEQELLMQLKTIAQTVHWSARLMRVWVWMGNKLNVAG